MKKTITVEIFIAVMSAMIIGVCAWGMNINNTIIEQGQRITTLERQFSKIERLLEKSEDHNDEMRDKINEVLVELQNKKDRD